MSLHVGDKLTFNYTSIHNVYLFPGASSYSNCDFSSAAALATSGPYTYTFQATGSYYFGCAVGTHCASGGMHLAVTVAA